MIIGELQNAAVNAVGLVGAQFEDDEPGSVLSAHLLAAMAAMSQNRKDNPKRNTHREPVLLRSASQPADRGIVGDMRNQVARGFAIAAMGVLRDRSIVGCERKPAEKPTAIDIAAILAGGSIQLSLRKERGEADAEAPITHQAVLGWLKNASRSDRELADHLEAEIREAIAAAPTRSPLECLTKYAESLGGLRKV
jgi:hypothetical protein